MTPDEEAEAYARIVYYLPWVTGARVPPGFRRNDPDSLILWLAQRPIRLYLLLSRFCPSVLLPMLEAVWPSVAKSVLDDELLNAIDAQDAPKMFGRDAFARKAYDARLRMIDRLHETVVSLWRTGGNYIIAGGKDFSGVVRENEDELLNMEAGILGLVEQAQRTPSLSDEQLVSAARDVVVNRAAAKGTYTPADLKEVAALFKADLVPEARRRAASSGLGQVLAEAEKRWRAEGMSKGDIAKARVEMVDTLEKAGK